MFIDIIKEILVHLPITSIQNVKMINKKYHIIQLDKQFWINKYKYDDFYDSSMNFNFNEYCKLLKLQVYVKNLNTMVKFKFKKNHYDIINMISLKHENLNQKIIDENLIINDNMLMYICVSHVYITITFVGNNSVMIIHDEIMDNLCVKLLYLYPQN